MGRADGVGVDAKEPGGEGIGLLVGEPVKERGGCGDLVVGESHGLHVAQELADLGDDRVEREGDDFADARLEPGDELQPGKGVVVRMGGTGEVAHVTDVI